MRCNSDHSRLTSEQRRLETHLPLLAIRSAVRFERAEIGAGVAGVNSVSFATSRLRDFTTIFFDLGMGLWILEGAFTSYCKIRYATEISRVREQCYVLLEIRSGK